MNTFRGIGLMAGTSLDGLDIVFCEFHDSGESVDFEVKIADCIPFGEQWESRLAHLHEQSGEIYARTHVYFGHWLGKTVADFISRHEIQPQFVASHGQTIFHQPEKNFTAQIGDGESMVAYLPCPLVTNFRNKNVALGGEGAPLVPFGEKYLFRNFELFLNLGGIANIAHREAAFDICPCNQVLNFLIQSFVEGMNYDKDGEIAASGTVDEDFLKALNELPFYQDPPPKSLGREWVESEVLPLLNEFTPTVPDALRTFVEHIAIQVARAAALLKSEGKAMLVTGGGRHNTYLMERIAAHLTPVGIDIPEVPGDWIDYKEAIVFAFLGLYTLLGKPNTLPGATGTKVPVLGGAIHMPHHGGFSLL